jgi:uncharacterized protein with von Willebrand factor type A (vWA) domain
VEAVQATGAGPANAGLPEAVVALVADLAARLRRGGLGVSTSEVLDAARALAHVDLSRRSLVRAALKSALVKDLTHDVLFQKAFDAVFPIALRDPARHGEDSDGAEVTGGAQASSGDDDDPLGAVIRALREDEPDQLDLALQDALDRFSGARPGDGRTAGQHARQVLRRMNISEVYRRYLEAGDAETGFERAIDDKAARAALAQMERRVEELMAGRLRDSAGPDMQALEDLEDRPVLKAGPDELLAMRQALRPLARRLAARLGSKRRRGRSGLDMRRTIRASMGYGGLPVSPVLRRRRPTKPDLMVLCDVSGSTAQFAPFTLTLLHAVHQEFRRVRSFAFIDGIVEITDFLEGSPGVLDPVHLLGRRGLIVKDGRSDYALALAAFLRAWGDAVTAKTTVIIVGDARSHDRAPATAQVAALGHKARRLYWLNPEPQREWDTVDSRATEYAVHCTAAFEVATIRDLISAVTEIV